MGLIHGLICLLYSIIASVPVSFIMMGSFVYYLSSLCGSFTSYTHVIFTSGIVSFSSYYKFSKLYSHFEIATIGITQINNDRIWFRSCSSILSSTAIMSETKLSEREKSLIGLPYDAMKDRELVGLRLRARQLANRYNVRSLSLFQLPL